MFHRTFMERLAVALAVMLLSGSAHAAGIKAASGESFETIQAAIHASPAGSEIHIPAGSYHETVRIEKPIALIGEGAELTQIATGADSAWDQAGMRNELMAELERDAEGLDPDQARAKLEPRLGRGPLTIAGADGVRVVGLRLTGRARTSVLAPAVVSIEGSRVTMEDCAIVAAFGNGLIIKGKSNVEVRGCLLAAAWQAGIRIQAVAPNAPTVRIDDCDIRNNYYSGVVIGRGCNDVIVANCRVSGSAWHGVRYDDASPEVTGNAIFGNARCGIYASGVTAAQVTNNFFTANEMDAMSCWFQNADRIEGNTIVANLREGLSILGASSPKVLRNIIAHEKEGITRSLIRDEDPNATRFGDPSISQNIFWENEVHALKSVPEDGVAKKETLDMSPDNLLIDPLFVDAKAGNYALKPDSPALEQGIGVADPPTLDSKWALQPEEASIIPESATRDSFRWRHKQD